MHKLQKVKVVLIIIFSLLLEKQKVTTVCQSLFWVVVLIAYQSSCCACPFALHPCELGRSLSAASTGILLVTNQLHLVWLLPFQAQCLDCSVTQILPVCVQQTPPETLSKMHCAHCPIVRMGSSSVCAGQAAQHVLGSWGYAGTGE